VAGIDDIIAGRPEEEALRTLSIICSGLKRFDLVELNVSDNAMGAKGVESCRDLLSKKSLQVRDVTNKFLFVGNKPLLPLNNYRGFTCATTVFLQKL